MSICSHYILSKVSTSSSLYSVSSYLSLSSVAAVSWWKYCRYGVKLYPVNQTLVSMFCVQSVCLSVVMISCLKLVCLPLFGQYVLFIVVLPIYFKYVLHKVSMYPSFLVSMFCL